MLFSNKAEDATAQVKEFCSPEKPFFPYPSCYNSAVKWRNDLSIFISSIFKDQLQGPLVVLFLNKLCLPILLVRVGA